jgi:hypothetical protein
MSFFPANYDPRDDVIAMLDLVELDTPDGPARFIIGTDGMFTDTSGNVWTGSQLIKVSSLQAALDGKAPEGSLTLSFFQDPNADSLIEQIKDLGVDYIAGRPITFYFQPIRSQAEFSAPTIAPIQWMQRTMRTLTFKAGGAQDRSITLSFEAWAENRRTARRIMLNTEGHKSLIGETNVSLEFMPTTDFEEEKLFG